MVGIRLMMAHLVSKLLEVCHLMISGEQDISVGKEFFAVGEE
jgi:hypothetical protein